MLLRRCTGRNGALARVDIQIFGCRASSSRSCGASDYRDPEPPLTCPLQDVQPWPLRHVVPAVEQIAELVMARSHDQYTSEEAKKEAMEEAMEGARQLYQRETARAPQDKTVRWATCLANQLIGNHTVSLPVTLPHNHGHGVDPVPQVWSLIANDPRSLVPGLQDELGPPLEEMNSSIPSRWFRQTAHSTTSHRATDVLASTATGAPSTTNDDHCRSLPSSQPPLPMYSVDTFLECTSWLREKNSMIGMLLFRGTMEQRFDPMIHARYRYSWPVRQEPRPTPNVQDQPDLKTTFRKLRSLAASDLCAHMEISSLRPYDDPAKNYTSVLKCLALLRHYNCCWVPMHELMSDELVAAHYAMQMWLSQENHYRDQTVPVVYAYLVPFLDEWWKSPQSLPGIGVLHDQPLIQVRLQDVIPSSASRPHAQNCISLIHTEVIEQIYSYVSAGSDNSTYPNLRRKDMYDEGLAPLLLAKLSLWEPGDNKKGWRELHERDTKLLFPPRSEDPLRCLLEVHRIKPIAPRLGVDDGDSTVPTVQIRKWLNLPDNTDRTKAIMTLQRYREICESHKPVDFDESPKSLNGDHWLYRRPNLKNYTFNRTAVYWANSLKWNVERRGFPLYVRSSNTNDYPNWEPQTATQLPVHITYKDVVDMRPLTVRTLRELAMSIAWFRHKNQACGSIALRGQSKPYPTTFASLFRSPNDYDERKKTLQDSLHNLRAEIQKREGRGGFSRKSCATLNLLALLQHYECCDTPCVDLTVDPFSASLFALASRIRDDHIGAYKEENAPEADQYPRDAFVSVFLIPHCAGFFEEEPAAVVGCTPGGLIYMNLERFLHATARRAHRQSGMLIMPRTVLHHMERTDEAKFTDNDMGEDPTHPASYDVNQLLIARFRIPASVSVQAFFDMPDHRNTDKHVKQMLRSIYPERERDPMLAFLESVPSPQNPLRKPNRRNSLRPPTSEAMVDETKIPPQTEDYFGI